MRPRWQVALLVLTMPVWFLPAILYVGWCEAGKEVVSDIPRAVYYLATGKRPTF